MSIVCPCCDVLSFCCNFLFCCCLGLFKTTRKWAVFMSTRGYLTRYRTLVLQGVPFTKNVFFYLYSRRLKNSCSFNLMREFSGILSSIIPEWKWVKSSMKTQRSQEDKNGSQSLIFLSSRIQIIVGIQKTYNRGWKCHIWRGICVKNQLHLHFYLIEMSSFYELLISLMQARSLNFITDEKLIEGIVCSMKTSFL